MNETTDREDNPFASGMHAWKMSRPLDNGAFIFSREPLSHVGSPGFFLAADDGKGPALASFPPRTLRRWPDLVSLEPLASAACAASHADAIGSPALIRLTENIPCLSG